jgi:hypothetical protein
MKKFQVLSVIAVLLAGLGLLPVSAPAATVYTYTGLSDGYWNVESNWSGSHIPNGVDDQAWINKNPDTNVTVNLDTSPTVSGLTVDAGDKLQFNNGQSLYLSKDSLGNQPTVTNSGIIRLENNYYAYTPQLIANDATVTLDGGGTVELAGSYPSNNYLTYSGAGKFVNVNNTIRGAGHIDAPMTNNGSLIAENGTLVVSQAITGTGKVSVADGATLNLSGYDVHTGNFEMLGSAALTGGSGRTFNLTKNFSFTQTDESKWNSGAGFRLEMSGGGGGGRQSLEVGGHDYGAVDTGFTDNFHLEKLSLTEVATYAYLVDAFDNGNRGSPEALYVDSLSLADGTTLNLNGLHLYTYLEGYTEVLAGDTRFGGTIIDSPVPLPSTLLLLGSGLLGLAGLRRRFRQS